ncbi:DBH-like monooxygenase [Heracleum sosnowskyi]|uniref:DBH-like monooxygenase n=1 Tax=Heracleum sosnowskyi TaxID=360622 RepID=A0AAD8MC87_9APIA|nr:DBH-like monooxygenase [Heracleum sosnowskyi]
MMTTTQKRKAVDQVNHDFSDFSLSSPATKIRRLDYAELAPIMEEDEQQVEDETLMPTPPPFAQQEETAVEIGEVENEERAIVVFNPNNTVIQSSPSTFSLTPHILSRLKGKGHRDLWSKHHHLFNISSAQQDEDTVSEENDDISNQCLAVVPWVHTHVSPPPPPVQQIDASETMMMEDEQQNEQEIASMDIEQQQEECNNNEYATSGMPPSVVGFHQWQQQHCMGGERP